MPSKCIVCKTERAIYCTKDEKKCQYCKNCKLPDMININSKKCIICNVKEASYADSGEKVRKYCNDCKLLDMVNIASKKCIKCTIKKSSYAYQGEKSPKYCDDCKLENMVNIVSKYCIVCNLKLSSFAYPGEKSRKYCYDCKLTDMVNVNTKKCIVCNLKRALYCSKDENIPKYCNDCKLPDMVNNNNKVCKTDLCSTRISNKKYEGYCAYCFRNIFPDKPMSRNYKTKELHVVDFIKTNFTNLDIITDKQIYGGCSGKRPDIFIDLGYQIIIVEVDENQHINYSCENKRIMELSQDVHHRPIVFVRFNPDKYKKEDMMISSCWKINKNGICGISKLKEWNERLNTLKNTIEYWLKNKTEKTIEVIQLYYDE